MRSVWLRNSVCFVLAAVAVAGMALVASRPDESAPLPEEWNEFHGDEFATTSAEPTTIVRDEPSPLPESNAAILTRQTGLQTNRDPAADPFLSADNPSGDGLPIQPVDFDLAQTSWESPFDPACWQARGWVFDRDAMRATGDNATALFRRTYRRLMLECDFDPHLAAKGELRLRLIAPATKSVLSLAVTPQSMTVIDESREPHHLVKQGQFSAELKPGQTGRLRVAATGNRFTAGWNGKVIVSCDQPPAQSGRELHVEFVATGPVRITGLRVEGE